MENKQPLIISIFISDLLRGYGSENFTLQLANGLVEKGHNVDLIVQIAGGFSEHAVNPKIKQFAIGSRSPFAALLFLVPYLIKNKPQVFFTVMEKPSLLGIVSSFFARYKNIVPTIHFEIDSYTSVDHRFRRNILRLLLAVFYRYAPVVIAASNAAAASLQRWVGKNTPVKAIYNGFDLAALRKAAAQPVNFPWLENKSAPVIIACGRLVPQKGFDVLLQAFALLAAKTPVHLIILGEGELRKNLLKMAEDLGVKDFVSLPGFIPNPISWFARSDLFVLSSRTEGFGIVLIEAMASGATIVSTRCPGGPAEILRDGAYGQLVPMNDPISLAAAMEYALKNGKNSACQKEIQKYLDENFSIEKMIDSYLKIAESFAI